MVHRFRILRARTVLIVFVKDLLQVFPPEDVELILPLALDDDENADPAGRLNGADAPNELRPINDIDFKELPRIQLPRTTSNGLDLDFEHAPIGIHRQDVESRKTAGKGRGNPAPSTELRSGKILTDLASKLDVSASRQGDA